MAPLAPMAEGEAATGRSAAKLDLAVLGDAGCGKSALAAQLLRLAAAGTNSQKAAGESGTPPTSPTSAAAPGGLSRPQAQSGHFETASHRFALSEVPGDAETLKGLVASSFCGHADVALLVVSAAPGELERGTSHEGRSREHALLARVLGAERVVVAVTKMDATSNAYAEARFDEAARVIGEMLRSLGFSENSMVFVPVAAGSGTAENVAEPSGRMGWYSGPPLLQVLDKIQPPAGKALPCRVTVQEAYHLDSVGTVVVGRIEQGTLRLATTVQFAPGGGLTGRVKAVEVEKEMVQEAQAPDLVNFVVEDIAVQDLRRGMVASEAAHPAPTVESFLAQVVVLRGPGEVKVGFSPVLACHSAQVPCRVEELVARIDRCSGDVLEVQPSVLCAGDVGLVRFHPEQPLCVEAHSESPKLGQFATAPGQTTVTLVGVVREVQPQSSSPPPPPPAGTAGGGSEE